MELGQLVSRWYTGQPVPQKHSWAELKTYKELLHKVADVMHKQHARVVSLFYPAPKPRSWTELKTYQELLHKVADVMYKQQARVVSFFYPEPKPRSWKELKIYQELLHKGAHQLREHRYQIMGGVISALFIRYMIGHGSSPQQAHPMNKGIINPFFLSDHANKILLGLGLFFIGAYALNRCNRQQTTQPIRRPASTALPPANPTAQKHLVVARSPTIPRLAPAGLPPKNPTGYEDERFVVKPTSCLNRLGLIITAKKGPPPQRSSSLIFCVDTSGSMDTKNPKTQLSGLDEVKKACDTMLQAASTRAHKENILLNVGVIAFDSGARVICSPTTVLTDVQDKVHKLTASGGTRFHAALELAQKEIQKQNEQHPRSWTLIFLSDGEDEAHSPHLVADQVTALKAMGVVPYTIGIGRDHKKRDLVAISGEDRYIDAQAGDITRAIMAAYTAASNNVSSTLAAGLNLPQHLWRVIQLLPKQGLKEGETARCIVEIDPATCKQPLDLEQVEAYLRYIDGSGKKQELQFPWNPTTTIDADLWAAAH